VRRPLLLGHRGCRGSGSVENTLTAFEYALSKGCDGFEFDVRQTRDGRNVIWHDPEYNGRQIAATDYANLAYPDGSPLACVEDALHRFGHLAYLDVELKTPGAEAAIVAAVKVNPPQRQYIFTSFFPEILDRLHDLDTNLPLGFLCERRRHADAWRDLPVMTFLPRHDLIDSRLVEEVHDAGRQIMAWTVNSPRKMRRLAEWGIDGLISDDPQLLYQTFHNG
jgi:glycerophosphoryl diester phosphodiesterase